MPSSMTGYGRGQSQGFGRRITVEMKSVNHRFLEIQVKLPRQYNPFEEKVKNLIKEAVVRGRVDTYINIEETEEIPRSVKVDKELAIAYYNSLKELGELLQIPQNISLFELCQLPDVLKVEEQELDLEDFWQVVEEAVSMALKGMTAMRETEGRQLAEDLRHRGDNIRSSLAIIEGRSAIMTDLYRQKLLERLQELHIDVAIDEQRVAMEVAILAERSAITEELVRMKSHLKQLATTLESSEPMGRKLDFLVQELHREINTIGSKAGDLEISRQVVEVKSELEKIREQVQNLE
ncbi:MAG: YicC family protein [Clostridia bacterium]|nr:YicC family protein [Clostridia bacterium]